ncbi:MAG: hypothetical protein CMP07_11490 [Xanthomonadales bacterium]|nr:hypothetical protein [Xanthomonadales bacterium]
MAKPFEWAQVLRGLREWPAVLLLLFVLIWLALGYAPKYRDDWMLENALVVAFVPLLVWGYRRVRFSNLAYTAVFVFLVLHVLGSHYTYAEVPYDQWSRDWLGFSIDDVFGFERNHYDRLVHLLFGVLLAPLTLELVNLEVDATASWRRAIAVSLLLACSAIYELIEWAAAMVFGGELGMAYLGTQGDVWDSHKDTALALLGAVCATALLAWRRPGTAAHRR